MIHMLRLISAMMHHHPVKDTSFRPFPQLQATETRSDFTLLLFQSPKSTRFLYDPPASDGGLEV